MSGPCRDLQGLGRRERKKLETRKSLRAAALRLATDRGCAAVTTDEIAAAADVSPRTFFNYFSSKEEALAGQDPDQVDRLKAALVARPQDEPPLTSLRAIMLELAEELTERREEWQQRLALVRSDPLLLAASVASWNRAERALAEVVADRTGLDAHRDLYPSLAVGAVTSAMRAATMRWREEDGSELALTALVTEALDALAAGLPAPELPMSRPSHRTKPTRRPR